jgi:hypothetical protein
LILKDKDLAERKKLTSGFPAILCSAPGYGKSTAFANLSLEEKQRTTIFNFDNKQISDDDNEFLYVFHSFKVEDFEAVDNIAKNIMKAGASEKCDRIILDTVTLMTKFINRWASHHYSGFDVWNAYNNSITKILEALKETVITNGKFGYATGHYPPKEGGEQQAKRYLTTKGKEHTNVLEESFLTVVESLIEDRKVWLYADSFEPKDTTKTKYKDGHFKFIRHSIDDLERLLNYKVAVNDKGELVEVAE